MPTTEYDRIRLDALPAAFQLVADARQTEWKNTTGPIWQKLFRIGEAINKQLAAEVAAYFAEEEEERETPAPLKSSILKASAEAQGIPCLDLPSAPEPDAADLKGLPHTHRCPDCRNLTPCYGNAPNCADPYKVCADCAFKGLPGLQSLLATARAEGRATSPFNPADYPTGDAPKWYNDRACIVVTTDRAEAQRIAGVISNKGIDASVRTLSNAKGYAVEVSQRDEARANRAIELSDEEEEALGWTRDAKKARRS